MKEQETRLQIVLGDRNFTVRIELRDPSTEIVQEQVPDYLKGSLERVLAEPTKLRWFTWVNEDGRDVTDEVGRWPLGASTARKALKNGSDYVIDYVLGEPRANVVDDDSLVRLMQEMRVPSQILDDLKG